MVKSSEEDPLGLFLVTVGMNVTTDSWILDFGCDCHMCYSRDLFDTYTSCDGASVFMANNAKYKSIGRGMVKIKMFDGVV